MRHVEVLHIVALGVLLEHLVGAVDGLAAVLGTGDVLMICVICVEAVPIDFGESIIALPRAKPC